MRSCQENLTELNLHVSTSTRRQHHFDPIILLNLTKLEKVTVSCRILETSNIYVSVSALPHLTLLDLNASEIVGSIEKTLNDDEDDENDAKKEAATNFRSSGFGKLTVLSLSVKNIRVSTCLATNLLHLVGRQSLTRLDLMRDLFVDVSTSPVKHKLFSKHKISFRPLPGSWEREFLAEIFSAFSAKLTSVCVPRLFNGMAGKLARFDQLSICATSCDTIGVDQEFLKKSLPMWRSVDSGSSLSLLSYNDIYGAPKITGHSSSTSLNKIPLDHQLLKSKNSIDLENPENQPSTSSPVPVIGPNQSIIIAPSVIKCRQLHLSSIIDDLEPVVDLVRSAPDLREIVFHTTFNWDALMGVLGSRQKLTKITLKITQLVHLAKLARVLKQEFCTQRETRLENSPQDFLYRTVIECHVEKKRFFDAAQIDPILDEQLFKVNVRFRFVYT